MSPPVIPSKLIPQKTSPSWGIVLWTLWLTHYCPCRQNPNQMKHDWNRWTSWQKPVFSGPNVCPASLKADFTPLFVHEECVTQEKPLLHYSLVHASTSKPAQFILELPIWSGLQRLVLEELTVPDFTHSVKCTLLCLSHKQVLLNIDWWRIRA